MFSEAPAFLFDLDGTLVHSELSIKESWDRFADENNFSPPALSEIHGIPAIDTIKKFIPGLSEDLLFKYAKRMEELEIETANLVHPIKGALELLNYLDNNNIPWNIVTSGTLPLASARLKAIGLNLPSSSITFEMVKKGKPDPEPFIKGSERLSLLPQMCWAVEDSISGLRSAREAGCKTIAILTHYEKDQLPNADLYVEDLSEVLNFLIA